MASTKEQIAEAARMRFKTREIPLADGISVTVRELSPAEKKALRVKVWKHDANGAIIVVDDKGVKVAEGQAGSYELNDGVNFAREWIAATMTQADAVDGIMSDDVPDSVKEEIFEAARAINGYENKATIAKNS